MTADELIAKLKSELTDYQRATLNIEYVSWNERAPITDISVRECPYSGKDILWFESGE